MGAEDATLKQGGWGYPKGIHHMSLIPRPMEASSAGSHVKPNPRAPGILLKKRPFKQT